jgi:hypothetical protein
VPKKNARPSSKRDARTRRLQLEEARRRQQQRERRLTLLTIGTGVLVGGGLIAGVLVPNWLSAQAAAAAKRPGHVSSPTKAAKAAGCTGIRNDKTVSRQHVVTAINYPSSPPSSGEHNPNPLPEAIRFYARNDKTPLLVERAVHDLEHGFVVGWYDPKLPPNQVEQLQKVAQNPALQRFIAVPWNRGTFSGTRHFVLTAWDRTERCTSVTLASVQEFDTKLVNAATAPEAGSPGGTMPSAPSSAPRPVPSRKPTAPASAKP